MSCCKGNFCPAFNEDVEITLIAAKWGYQPGDPSINWIEAELKQWLVNNKYAVIVKKINEN
jgi:hypothetical protein